MHESTLMAGLVRQIEEVARAHHAARVTGVTLALGPLAAVSVDHLREHFGYATAGTVAAGARLTIVGQDDLAGPGTVLLRDLEIEAEETP